MSSLLVGFTMRGRVSLLNKRAQKRREMNLKLVQNIEGIEWQREMIRQRKIHEAEMAKLNASDEEARKAAQARLAKIQEEINKTQALLDEAADDSMANGRTGDRGAR